MPIMLVLKNVKKENNIITADCYPENSCIVARISLEDKDMTTFKGKFTGYEDEYVGYLSHARRALMDMAEGKRDIEDCVIMWY